MSGFLSKFDTDTLNVNNLLGDNTAQNFSWLSDSNVGRYIVSPLNPLGSMFLSGESGLLGTPTEKATQDRWATGLTELAHNYGAETALAVFLGMEYAGQGGFGGFGGEEAGAGVGAGDTGMGGGYNVDPGGESMHGMGEPGYDPGGEGMGGLDQASNSGYGNVNGDPNSGGSEFSKYPGETNALDNEPGWNSGSSSSSSSNSGPNNSGTNNGVPQNSWQSWAKSVGPAAVSGALQMYNNARNNKSAEARAKQAREDYLARQQQQDNPPVNPYIAKIGPMTAQHFAEDPLATYGQRKEHQFYKASGGLALAHGDEMSMHEPQMHAGPEGGLDLAGRVRGEGGGQDDIVPAMLAPDEYVWDADTVAAIGDGSSDEGARRLDDFREQIRKQKRSAPISKIPPKTKPLHSYLRMAA